MIELRRADRNEHERDEPPGNEQAHLPRPSPPRGDREHTERHDGDDARAAPRQLGPGFIEVVVPGMQVHRVERAGEPRQHVETEDGVPEVAAEHHRLVDEPRRDRHRRDGNRQDPVTPGRDDACARLGSPHEHHHRGERQKERRHELGQEPEREIGAGRRGVPRRTAVAVNPPREVKHAAAITEEERRLHVVAAQTVLVDERVEGEERERRRQPAQGSAESRAEEVDVDERDRAEERVEQPHADLVLRDHADFHQPRHHPELQRRFLEKWPIDLDAARRQPLARLEDPVDRIRIDGFVAAQVPALEPDEERRAEEHDDKDEPGPLHERRRALWQLDPTTQLSGHVNCSMTRRNRHKRAGV